MGKYIGKKHLDAEMEIDLEKGIVIMDYTLNKFQADPEDSSNSFFNFDKIQVHEVPLLVEIAKIIRETVFRIAARVMSHERYRNKLQMQWQQFLKERHENQTGINEYTVEGQFDSKKLIYHLDTNLWFEYELEGDYKNKIQRILLKRRFVKNTINGRMYDLEGNYIKDCSGEKMITQDGWNLIFEFKGIPIYGSCVIRYV